MLYTGRKEIKSTKGMSQRDIASTIEDIYGFNISAETISDLEEVQE